MKESWLNCKVLDGMFSDEAVITISNGWSYFVDRDATQRITPDKGRVRVRTFEQAGATWAILPTKDVEIVGVESSELERIAE